jgi:RNA polymerase sigma-70 factor, ECF subfamily
MPEELKELLANDDAKALDWLYDNYAEELYKFLYHRAPSDAEDVLQKVFLKLASKKKALIKVAHLRSYLFSIALNELRDLLRKQKKITRKLHSYKESLEREMPEQDYSNLHSQLAQLPDNQQEVISLKVFAKLKFHEIADVLSISPNTAASRYRYAIDKLKKLLKGQ